MRSILVLLFLLISVPAGACFGPKLFLGTPPGVEGELLFHLVSIYVKEKTGIESLRLEMTAEQTADGLLKKEEVDLAFDHNQSQQWGALLQVGEQLYLLSGPRPTQDLQFTTVPRVLSKLQRLLDADDLSHLRQQVTAGVLPAKAVRSYYMQQGWI